MPGAVKQHTLSRFDADGAEGLAILDAVDDVLDQDLLDVFEPANAFPIDVARHLDDDFAHGGRLDALQGQLEIGSADAQAAEVADGFEVDDPFLVHAPQGAVGRLAAQRCEIGADEAVAMFGEAVEIDVVGERHAAREFCRDFGSAHLIGNADVDFVLESARAAQGGIDGVDRVGGADDGDAVEVVDAVHQGEERGNDAVLHFPLGAIAGLSGRSNRVSSSIRMIAGAFWRWSRSKTLRIGSVRSRRTSR